MAGSYVCFARAIAGQKFSRQTLRKWFYQLVDKSDYAKNEVKELLAHLEHLTNSAEGNKKQGETRA